MMKRLLRLAKNPTVQKVAAWLGPIILGWIMTKLEDNGSKSTTTKKRTTTKRR